MKRYSQPEEYCDMMGEDVGGEWIRYSDHVEAMKRIADPSASAQQAVPVANNEAYDLAYDKIDRFLRSNLDDDDYAEFSRALDSLFAAPAPAQQAEQVCPACKGAGQIATGCDEFSESICKTCDGTGFAAPAPSASPAALTDGLDPLRFIRHALKLADRLPDSEISYTLRLYLNNPLLAASPADQVEDARDAARYRWLRENGMEEAVLGYDDSNWGFSWLLQREQLDSGIDAAMSASKEGA